MKKAVAILALILIVVLGPALWLNTRVGVTIEDHFLYRRSSGEYKSVTGWSITCDPSTNRFAAVLAHQHFGAQLEWNDPVARFTFDDGETVEGRWHGSGYLISEDGSPLFLDDAVYITVGNDNMYYYITNTDIADEFMQIYTDDLESYGSIGLVLLGVLIYAIGAVQFLFPEETHFLFSRWYYEKPALSADGIMFEKLGAILVLITGAAVMFAPLFA